MKPVVITDPPRTDPAVIAELGELGVRRVSTGGALARAAYTAFLAAAQELRDEGTSTYAGRVLSTGELDAKFTAS